MFNKLLSLVALSQICLFVSAQTITGQYDCLPAGSYTLCQNLWGMGILYSSLL
jgi:xyloglucan-specific endo-beta-1,4-glucanase